MSYDGDDPAEQSSVVVDTPGRDDRVVVARGVFCGPDIRIDPRLYAGGAKNARLERFGARLPAGSVVDTDTYFGRFAASYWQQWTAVDAVQVVVAYEAAATLRVSLVAGDIEGQGRKVQIVEVSGTGSVTLGTRLDRFLDGGALWLEFHAVDGAAEITGVEWTVDRRELPDRSRASAIVICTHNRTADCVETLRALGSDPAALIGVRDVYVIDQGSQAVSDEPDFADVDEALAGRLRYIRQPNLGGAGGFTRGIHEARESGDVRQIVLMDDDIICEPETVLRLTAFAIATAKPTLVGAQMLRSMRPGFIHHGGESIDLAGVKAGRWAPNARHGVSMIKKRQDRRVDVDYNAWWTCLVPTEVVDAIGLPLPLFFQWDDIEFGIRARDRGFPTVTLSNAGVWHQDFEWKDRDDWAKYFSIRNSLIASALHHDIDGKALAAILRRELLRYAVSMQYGLARTMLAGVEDFLRGPEVLHDGGAEAIGRIRAMRRDFPETVIHPAHEIPLQAQARTVLAGHRPNKRRIDLVLAKRVVQQLTGRTIGGVVRIPIAEAHWWHVGLFDTAIVTDASQSGAHIRRRDPAQVRAIVRDTIVLTRRFASEVESVSARYRADLGVLTDAENWKRLFDV
jgi:galactofuranosylgalactofuranosylrhamnosyl-N-acetylglucosaminyl-diphospho-decaprenol beta-1,5/1,6-galactofuranosyltransferase